MRYLRFSIFFFFNLKVKSELQQLLMQLMYDCALQDGTEMWQRWEELVHLLWMLLLSYNKAMNGETSLNIRTLHSSVYCYKHKIAPFKFSDTEENREVCFCSQGGCSVRTAVFRDTSTYQTG